MLKRLKIALLVLACLIPLSASAMVQQHPLHSPATSLASAYDTAESIFPDTPSDPHETLVIIEYSDGSVLSYTCRNNPMGGYDALGLAVRTSPAMGEALQAIFGYGNVTATPAGDGFVDLSMTQASRDSGMRSASYGSSQENVLHFGALSAAMLSDKLYTLGNDGRTLSLDPSYVPFAGNPAHAPLESLPCYRPDMQRKADIMSKCINIPVWTIAGGLNAAALIGEIQAVGSGGVFIWANQAFPNVLKVGGWLMAPFVLPHDKPGTLRSSSTGLIVPPTAPKPGSFSDRDARLYYNEYMPYMREHLQMMRARGSSYENVSRRASAMRSSLAERTRVAMANQYAAKGLRAHRPFNYYVNKYREDGYDGDALWIRIIEKSLTPNPEVNTQFQVESR